MGIKNSPARAGRTKNEHMKPIIEVQNISKQYRLGGIGTGSLKADIHKWWYQIRGKEDPYLRIGETNDRSIKGDSDYVWALRNISFNVNPGEVLGIIGRNGAGKSTLLKILSRITTPTTGSIKMKGRVASLLEVGTGMHPELTGRENIYLNGAILGMRKNEITRKLDEIVAFSGVERYVDTPVKRYSSGMHVRLGFAVAAHLEPEILIVDEVLAVGDIEFQEKCIGKMNDISHREGRTVLFVSHNLKTLQSICDRGILIHNGEVVCDDTIGNAIGTYQQLSKQLIAREAVWTNETVFEPEALLQSLSIKDEGGSPNQLFNSRDAVHIHIKAQFLKDVQHVKVGFDLYRNRELILRSCQVDSGGRHSFGAGEALSFALELPGNFLNEGTYEVAPHFSIHCVKSLIAFEHPVVSFRVQLNTEQAPFNAVLNEQNHSGLINPVFPYRILTTHTHVVA